MSQMQANLYPPPFLNEVIARAPAIILFNFPFHTGDITSGAREKGTSTESRHSVEEQSSPTVNRKYLQFLFVSEPWLAISCIHVQRISKFS